MLSFTNLSALIPYYEYITQKISLPDNKPFFFVGGAIRDLLLGIITQPDDIDLSCGVHPDVVKKCIDKTNISLFDTEKYGTITIIPKENQWLVANIQYEITPFRTETGYTDIRHPDNITWSESLIEDSKRRDFTINALYATILTGYSLIEKIEIFEWDKKMEKQLQEQGFLCLPNNTLLVQNTEIIDTFSQQHNFDNTIINNQIIIHQQSTSPLILLIDPQLGFNDLCNKELKAVGNPLMRMNEDALRVLRGARFINTLNQSIKTKKITQNPPCFFDVENATWKAMQKSFHLVKSLPKERLHQELMKVFSKKKPFEYMATIDELGLIPQLFPALERCKNVRQPMRYHPFSIFDHILLVLKAIQDRNDSPLLKFAALYHDVGKVDQYHYHALGISKDEKGSKLTGSMYHTNIGPELVKTDFGNLGFSNQEIEEIMRYVLRHHRPGEILDADPKKRTKKIRELLSEGGLEKSLNLIDLAIADRIGQMNPIQPMAIDELEEMKITIQQLYETEGQFTMKQMLINGNILMRELSLQPGKVLGELLQKSFAFVRDNPSERNNLKELLQYCKQLLKSSGKKKKK